VARHYTAHEPAPTLLAYTIVAFAPPLLLYSYQVWVEIPAALLLMLALDRLLVLQENESRARDWFALALPMLLLPLVKLRFGLLSGGLVLLALVRLKRSRLPLLLLVATLSALAAVVLLANWHFYGNPLKIHSFKELLLFRYPPAAFARGLTGMFYDVAFGLFFVAPIWMLLLPSLALTLVPSGKSRIAKRLLADLTIVALPYFAIVVPRPEWYGGWSPPFRYGLVVLPLLGLLLVPALAVRSRSAPGILASSLAIATLVLTLVWLTAPGLTYAFADGRARLLDSFEAATGLHLLRFLPSSVRPRAATWIWPVATLALATAWLWRPRRRPRAALAWGATLLFVVLAAIPFAARTLPTRVIEIESPAVTGGGQRYPELWVVDRTRFEEGIMLREGQRRTSPVVAGGASVEIAVRCRFDRRHASPLALELWAGEQKLGEQRADSSAEWQDLRFGPLAWPQQAPLVLALPAARHRGVPNGLLVDRVTLSWQ
jgi:hypothetical protein